MSMKLLLLRSMSKTRLILYCFLISTMGLWACNPDQFYLNSTRNSIGTYIYGQKLTSIDSVEDTADNAFIINDGGQAALSSDLNTDFIADFTVSITQGNGARFRFRTTKHTLSEGRELAFVYSTTGSRVESNGTVIATLDTVRALANTPERVIITNWGRKYTIQVGCNIVYYGTSTLPTTEFVITESLPSSTVYLSGIDFIPIHKASDSNTPKARAEREVW